MNLNVHASFGGNSYYMSSDF